MVDELGTWLASEIKHRGWSMSELGRRAGYSQSQISNVVNGVANPSADFVIAVADALEQPPETLLRLSGHLPRIPPPTDLDIRVARAFRNLDEGHKAAVAHIVLSLDGVGGMENAPAVPSPRPALPDPDDIPDWGPIWDEVCIEMEYCGKLLLDDWTTDPTAIQHHFRVLAATLAHALLEIVGEANAREWGGYAHRLLTAHLRHLSEDVTSKHDQPNTGSEQ